MSRVLVTGAGGPAGIAVIRACGDHGHHVVAADSEMLSAGLFLADDAVVVAGAEDGDGFIADLSAAIEKFAVDVVVPTVADEMVVLSGREDEVGAALWIPSREAVETCLDKWRFWNELAPTGVPVIPTALGDDPDGVRPASLEGVPGPWIVKPRFGRGSRDVYAVDGRDELAWACRRVPEPIIQTRVKGREFTVDVLTDRDGAVAGAVPRWRHETKAGISTKGETFVSARVVREAAATIAAVGLHGAANVQGFVTPEGDVWVIEVNPRFSGGLPLSLASGSDLVGEFIRGALGQEVRADRLKFRPGLTMIRHFSEVYTG